MALDGWPEADRTWGARYVVTLAGQDGVNRALVVERERVLIAALGDAGAPADELFGDPAELARADAAEFGTPDADSDAAEGLGMRDVLAYSGFMLILPGVLAGGMTFFDGSGPIDVAVGPVAAILGIVVGIIAGSAAVAFFTAGRMKPAVWGVVVALAVVLGAATMAGSSGRGAVLVADAPRWCVALACLLPAVLVLVLWRLVSARTPQTVWTDDQWFERFRGTLRAKGVSTEAAAEHERSLRADLASSAMEEYGQPGAMAQSLAKEDPTVPRRRWWWGAAGWFALTLLSALLAVGESGLELAGRVALTVGLLVFAASWAWRSRPQKAAA